MAIYKTIQRQELIRFLKTHDEEAFTISEIFEYMKNDTEYFNVPAQSTIYRLIRELTESGIVKRTVKGNSRQFVYQILKEENCLNHLHMKCSVCGQMYHLSEEISKIIAENVMTNNSFSLGNDTVLSGKCVKCK